jgi:hypothetical protein
MDSRKVSEAQIAHYLNQRDARRQSEIPLSLDTPILQEAKTLLDQLGGGEPVLVGQ